jgi:hypothetical protein
MCLSSRRALGDDLRADEDRDLLVRLAGDVEEARLGCEEEKADVRALGAIDVRETSRTRRTLNSVETTAAA